MSNTILTHQMIAREAAAILSEEMNFVRNINTGREDDMQAKVNGYKKGGSVKIKLPPPSKVYDGATFAGGGSADDQIESYVTSTLSTQKHVPMTFTAIEKALSLDDFSSRFLRPALSTLASVVQADLLSKAMKLVPNVVGSYGSVPTTMKTYAQARSAMQRFLAPESPRSCLFSSDANTELVDASKALFNPNREIEKMFLKGYLGSAQGMEFFENQSLPLVTYGNKVAAVTVNGAGQTGSTLSIKGLAGADTFKQGTTFTIAGLYEVHPLTGIANAKLRRFVITADATSAGATLSISIWPPIKATAPGATVSATAADGAALVFDGAASTSYRQNLAFQRDAFATAFAPLPILASCEGYTAELNGIAVRVMTFGNGLTDTESTRIDVLYADPVSPRPDHAVRITE